MNEEIKPEEMKDEIPEEKLTFWQKIKKWVIGGTTAAVTIGAITVGVVTKSGHEEGDIYVINPITLDSLWYGDTTEAKAVIDSFSKICLIKEVIVPQKIINEKVYLDTLGHFEMRDRIVPEHIETQQARTSAMLNFKEGSVIKGVFTLDDSTIAVLYYKISRDFTGLRPWVGKMDVK